MRYEYLSIIFMIKTKQKIDITNITESAKKLVCFIKIKNKNNQALRISNILKQLIFLNFKISKPSN